MVGALSIVRFRTAVKDPVDTVFMFWSITCGIMAGAGFYIVGGVACALMGILYVLIVKCMKASKMPYLLVIRYELDKGSGVIETVKKLPKHRIKSRTATPLGGEISVELSLRDSESDTLDKIMAIDGVLDASLVSYEGEFGL